ncbi:MAG: efflux RND transporter periplasmic adaptor subunit [Gammaproteobacteria bacterium]
MSKRLIISTGLLAITAIGIVLVLVWQNMNQQAAAPQGFPPAVVAATEVIQEHWQPSYQSVGSMVASNGINVSTEVNGIVSEIVFSSGQPVKQGQILIKLDDSVDEAALEALRAESKLTQIQFSRSKDLLKKQVTSKSEFDEAQARYEAARARVKQQEAIIKRKVIRAPFAGLAGIRQVDLGQYIDAGSPIVSLQALDPIYVDYTVPERYFTRIRPGQVVKIQLDAIPEQMFSGEISAVNSGIEVGTRTLKVRATISNTDSIMRPGMFAQVETIIGEAQPVLTLPRTAISFNTYGNFVFVINKNEQAMLMLKRTAIETSEVRAGRVAIKGLSAGVQVVRTGLVKVRDGMPVVIDNQVELNDAEIRGE